MKKEINAYHLYLRPIKSTDLEQLRNWRNAVDIREKMLSQSIISIEQQKKWFDRLIENDDKKSSIRECHFIVEYKSNPVGYANYKSAQLFSHFKGNAQTGLYIGEKKYRGSILAFCLALALLDFVFLELEEQRLDAVVLAHNQAALRFNDKLGYQIVSDKKDLVTMLLTRENYLQARKELKKIIRI